MSLFSGLLSSLALPTVIGSYRLPDLGFVAWFSFVPLYLTLTPTPSRQRERGDVPLASAFKKGFLFGVAYYGLSLYWIFIAMHRYGEVSVGTSFLGVSLAVTIMALFTALACLLAIFLAPVVPLSLSLPLAWVVQDFARNFFPFGGFAWANIAYTQRSFLTLLQVLDLTGVYGLSFLLILSNALLAELWIWMRKRRQFPFSLAVFFCLLFALVLIYGKLRLTWVREASGSLPKTTISLIQGNISQGEKWIEENSEEIISRHLKLSRPADLIVWPEAAFPAVLPPEIDRINLLRALPGPLLMGVVAYEGSLPSEWPPRPEDKSFALYNAAVLIEPGGRIVDRYYKTHLVPMGEYVPLHRWLFFLSKIVPSISSFTPGRELNLMKLPPHPPPPHPPRTAVDSGSLSLGGRGVFGITICYEDLFPEISRTLTQKGADFLVNLTNDAWYEHSSAVFQHADFSRYRAIENRRTMVRATNTGVTGFFSPAGETIASAPVFEEATLTAEVPVGGATSFYTRKGDLFAWGCVLGVILLAGAVCLKNSKNVSRI